MFMQSNDGGKTWSAPLQVNPAGTTDKHHVLPAIAIDGTSVHVTYYTQHSNNTLDLDMANSHDRGLTFPSNRTLRVSSTSFSLPPTNIPIPTASNPFARRLHMSAAGSKRRRETSAAVFQRGA